MLSPLFEVEDRVLLATDETEALRRGVSTVRDCSFSGGELESVGTRVWEKLEGGAWFWETVPLLCRIGMVGRVEDSAEETSRSGCCDGRGAVMGCG